MNIKSLLLGSAAALVAVTGAKAADAPVTMVEPEPVEYVRVCDVYGTGFFYIPGTETCLKIGGYVRFRAIAGDKAFDQDDVDEDNNQGFITETRARLDFDAREETELGTLRAKIRVQATNTGDGFNTGDAAYGMDEGYIQLGGLTVGYLDSVWAGEDGDIADGLLAEENDFSVGDGQQNRISYTAAFGGVSATLSLEDDGTLDFVPDVLAKIAYKGSFGGFYVTGVFDEEAASPDLDPFDGGGFGLPNQFGFGRFDSLVVADDYDDEDSAFAIKAGLQLENLLAADSILKIEGHYAFDPTIYAVNTYLGDAYGLGAASPTDNIPAEWQIGAGYQQEFGKLLILVNGVYGELFDTTIDYPAFTLDADGGEFFGFTGDIGYDLTENLSAIAEVSYRKIDLSGGLNDYDETSGFLQLRRNF
jgi:hypothetical protein